MGLERSVRRALPALLFLGVAGAAQPAPVAAPASLESAIREGTTAYVRGEYRDAARILEQALGPKLVAGAADAAHEPVALSHLANLYRLQGRYAEAETAARRAVARLEQALGADDPEVARELSRLGGVLRAQGRYREAEAVLLDVLDRLRPYGVDHAYVATCLASLAELSRLQRRFGEAERRYWRAYMIRSYLYGAESSPVGETLSGLAGVLAEQGRDAEARPLLARALAIAEKPPRSDNSWDRLDERDLREMNRPERDTVAKRGVISVREGAPRHLEHAQHFDNLGRLYRAHGRYADAEAMQRRAIGIRERAFGREHPQVAQSLLEIGLIRRQQGDLAQALEYVRAAGGVARRRITAWPAEHEDYAQGERRRWQPLFLLELSLLDANDAGSFAAAFAALQYANIAAGNERALGVEEVRALLEPGEALVVTASAKADLYIAVVQRDGARWQRLEGQAANAEAAIRGAMGAARYFLVAGEGAAQAGAAALLPSVGALRTLKGRRAAQ